MIEPLTEHFEAHSIVCPLDVAEGFSQGVGSIVSREIDSPGPTLDHAVHGLDGQRAVLSCSRFKKIVLRLAIFTGEVWVISPFLVTSMSRGYATCASFMAGVMPPMPMLGRSLL